MAATEGRAEGSGETGCSELSITCELGLCAIVKEARVGLTGFRKCGIELPLTLAASPVDAGLISLYFRDASPPLPTCDAISSRAAVSASWMLASRWRIASDAGETKRPCSDRASSDSNLAASRAEPEPPMVQTSFAGS